MFYRRWLTFSVISCILFKRSVIFVVFSEINVIVRRLIMTWTDWIYQFNPHKKKSIQSQWKIRYRIMFSSDNIGSGKNYDTISWAWKESESEKFWVADLKIAIALFVKKLTLTIFYNLKFLARWKVWILFDLRYNYWIRNQHSLPVVVWKYLSHAGLMVFN